MSVAEKYHRFKKIEPINEEKKNEEDLEQKYVALFSFKNKPSPKFYLNLKKLNDLDSSHIETLRAMVTGSKEKAHTIAALAQHYGATTTLYELTENNQYKIKK
jgi:hypothetical protein